MELKDYDGFENWKHSVEKHLINIWNMLNELKGPIWSGLGSLEKRKILIFQFSTKVPNLGYLGCVLQEMLVKKSWKILKFFQYFLMLYKKYLPWPFVWQQGIEKGLGYISEKKGFNLSFS